MKRTTIYYCTLLCNIVIFMSSCSNLSNNTDNNQNMLMDSTPSATVPAIVVQEDQIQIDANRIADLLCQADEIIYMQVRTHDLSYKKQEMEKSSQEVESITNKYNKYDKVKLEDAAEKLSNARCADVIDKLKREMR